MLEAIAIGVFVFVVIVVTGFRVINRLEAAKAEAEADRLKRVASRASRVEYTGGRFNVHGREIEE